MNSSPSEASCDVLTPLLVSFIEDSYHLLRLFTGSWVTVGICCSATVNATASSILTFLIKKLQDFFGLKFILHHAIKASRLAKIPRVSSSLEHYYGGIEHLPPRLSRPALPSTASNITSIAITNSFDDIVHRVDQAKARISTY
ncbi:hypothetical protein ElyMa_006371800 [Elysia marginata]|uniref:Uncharacterized protein n=1 Tax=Elysia marginata TaxID=1093978 RepID=A0AAV4HMB8_9GAST|nr:hypothetical protein ElyMa_006371800 [Elysia marginata]